MTRPEKLGTRAVAVAVLVAGGQPAFGAGYYLPNQDAFTTAKGGAWVATADSAAAVHYNAAGLTQLERPEAALGAYVINLGTEVTTATGKFRAKSEWQPVPHLYYGMPLCEDLAFGFGINSPFGLGADWGQASPFRTVITEARLAYVSGTAALAQTRPGWRRCAAAISSFQKIASSRPCSTGTSEKWTDSGPMEHTTPISWPRLSM